MDSLPEYYVYRYGEMSPDDAAPFLAVLGYPSDRTCWRLGVRGRVSSQGGKRKPQVWEGKAEIVGFELKPSEPRTDLCWLLTDKNDQTRNRIVQPILTRVSVQSPLYLERNYRASGEPYDTLCGLEQIRSKGELDRHLRELWPALSLIRDIEGRGRPRDTELDEYEQMILAEAHRIRADSGASWDYIEEHHLKLPQGRLAYLRRKERRLSGV